MPPESLPAAVSDKPGTLRALVRYMLRYCTCSFRINMVAARSVWYIMCTVRRLKRDFPGPSLPSLFCGAVRLPGKEGATTRLVLRPGERPKKQISSHLLLLTEPRTPLSRTEKSRSNASRIAHNAALNALLHLCRTLDGTEWLPE